MKINWYKSLLIFSILSLSFTGYLISNSINELAKNNQNNPIHFVAKDTIIKYVPDDLSNIGNLIYFEGNIKSYNKKIADSYQYSVDFPEEIWRGNISTAISKNNVKYLIWTKNPIDTSIVKVQGYFTKINDTKFGLDDNNEYVYMLLPVFSVSFENN